jgi:cell fate regulator YaaT (PSP1 superfamily)
MRTATDGGQPIGTGAEPCIPPDEVLAGARRHHREQEAFRIALLKIRERALQMKLTRVEQAPDLSRLVFFFTAEGRVDFRDLVKELAAEFRTRIEMRQIGVRDEARMLGGYGSCGRQLCCSAWLTAFEPVSIKMAKLQDLTLNPAKLSGLCGRLKCCLRFELTDDKVLRKGRKSRDNGGAANGNGDEVVPDEPATGS